MTESISTNGDAAATNSTPEAPIQKTEPADSSNCVEDDLVCDDAYPDFSKLKGEVCLDDLSVRELQQTFRATFGRQTSVKDKLWLKRRIGMALSNSCRVPSMTFFIENEKVVKIGGVDCDLGVEKALGSAFGESVHRVKQVCEVQKVSKVSDVNLDVELGYDVGCDDIQLDHSGGKRVRKPTKRYIEELSEVEPSPLCGTQSASVKSSLRGRTIHSSRHSSIKNVYSDSKTAVTLLECIGGSSIQVPFASRVRRSRPRDNIASLMQLKFPEEKRESPVADAINMPSTLNPYIEPADSAPSTSDNEQKTVPPVTGEISRKHHRAWSLSEVMKLVEGVSRFGAGKWSEIKRLSFTAYPYRSSVDLKDKWRNLLRVSFADSSGDNKKVCSRKQIQTPLPAQILSKVRELAERQGQIPPISTKIIGSGERGPGSGFL